MEMSSSDTDYPTCDHRDHAGDDVPAVAQYEWTHITGAPTNRYWACPEHEPDGPALKRIDPGPENRSVDATNE